MSWLSAYLPSHQASAVMKRLDRAARLPLDENDTRTLAHRTTDLYVIDADETFWHRIITDPIHGDTLAHDYVGRFAPETLAKAIRFRDGVCRAPGPSAPHPEAACPECPPRYEGDVPKGEPWPTGPTNGDNMWALCRRHHSMKGHDVLQWILPSGRTVPA